MKQRYGGLLKMSKEIDGVAYYFGWVYDLVPSQNGEYTNTNEMIMPIVFEGKKNDDIKERLAPGTLMEMEDFAVRSHEERLSALKESYSGLFKVEFNKNVGDTQGIKNEFYFILNQDGKIEFMEQEEIDNYANIMLS